MPLSNDILLAVADQFGTPTYVYEEAVVRDRCRTLTTRLSGIPTRLLYAMKANSNPALIQIIRDEGLDLEAVSPGEVALLLKIGLPPAQIFYTANNTTDAEMHAVQETGVLFNIGEHSRLEKYGAAYPDSDVCVRLNPRIGAGHHRHVVTGGKLTKFGISLADIPDLLDTARRHRLRIVGLHQHIGSGISSTAQFAEAIEVLLDVADSFPDVRFLNFGGGLNVPYRDDEDPFDLEHIETRIVEPLRRFQERFPRPLEFWFEPGRYFVAEAGTLITRVNTIKQSGDRTFVGSDSGFNQLIRPILYDAYHRISNVSRPDGPLQTYDITGNICESGDLFARDRALPEIHEGDLLAIHDAGAYGMTMASEYNMRPLPAEVLVPPVGAPTLIRRRLTPDELADRYLSDVPVMHGHP